MNITGILDLNARKYGKKECLIYGDCRMTFAELKALAEQTAGLLQSWGISKGSRVALMSYNTPAFVTAFYGILKAGGVVVPVNHKLSAPEVNYIVKHSRSELILFDGALADVMAKLTDSPECISIDSVAEGFTQLEDGLTNAPAFTPVDIKNDDPAEILYTSGTTGNPKGCLHSHANVVAAGITATLAVKIDEQDILLIAMPIWHSSPLNNWFMGAQYMGAATVLVREYHPLHFLEAIQREKCTVYFGAPISYILPVQMIPNFDDYDLTSMRAWIYGGGPIAGDTAVMLMEKYKSDQFYQVYGMSESGPTGTVLQPRDQVKKAGSIGFCALPGADMKVMTIEEREAAPGETGEIWLKGDSMMAEYLNDEDATRNAFSDGWYKTGDVARLDVDGYLYIVDRMKDMIVTGGENVYSKEVEDALAAHPGVVESAVIGRPHPDWGETVSAIVVADKDYDLSEKEVQDFLADRLAKFKIPKTIEFVDELPHTPTGKVKKYTLR